ncbi:MAG TPA: bidirectional hydrogenase complex protein HoxE [Anaeromyxobacter sp.]|nr:bidirectional hydrogenase complex protein HoxE [Anaeromyxobacter sp.]
MNVAPAPTAAGGDKRLKMLDAAIRRQQAQPDALLEVLHSAQELYGFLADDVLVHVGRSLKLPLSRVYGVATFYNHFTLAPKGEHTCTVCLGTACYVKGAGEILRAARRELGVAEGQTTADGKVSLVVARCVGACGIAPAVVFDQEMAGKQTPEAVLARVKGWTR